MKTTLLSHIAKAGLLLLLSVVTASCSRIFPQEAPQDTKLLHPLIVEFPRFTTSYFDWPNTKEGREILQTWWEKSEKNIGVKVLPSIFMRGLSYHVLLFNDKFGIGFVDGGSEINYGGYHWRRSNQYDKVLYEYMIRVCETQKKLSTEEGERRVKEFHSHFPSGSKI